MNDNKEIKVPFLTRFFRAVAEDMEIPEMDIAVIKKGTDICGSPNDLQDRKRFF